MFVGAAFASGLVRLAARTDGQMGRWADGAEARNATCPDADHKGSRYVPCLPGPVAVIVSSVAHR